MQLSSKSEDILVQLVKEIDARRLRSPLRNEYLERLGTGSLTSDHLRQLVRVEFHTHRAQLAAYASVVARHPHEPTAGTFLDAAYLVHNAHTKLEMCARALGMSTELLEKPPEGPTAQAFSGFITWISEQGSQADNGLGLYVDSTSYFSDCAVLIEKLTESDVAAPDEFISYFQGGQSDELDERALTVVEYGLDHGDDPSDAVERAWLLEQHLERFWKAAATL